MYRADGSNYRAVGYILFTGKNIAFSVHSASFFFFQIFKHEVTCVIILKEIFAYCQVVK